MKWINNPLFAVVLFCLQTASAQQINGITPRQIIGGKAEVLTIMGSGFGDAQGTSYVSFFREDNNYSNAEQSKKFRYLSWKNNEIKMEMPVAFSNRVKVVVSGNELYSSDTLRVMANLSYRQENPLVYDLLTRQNQLGGITWYIHPVYWNNQEIRSAIAAVIQEFRCKTGVNYIIEPYPQWMPLNLNQGKYLIAPDSGLGVVGFNDRLWSSCILGAETFYHNSAQIIRMNTGQQWHYGEGQPPTGYSKFRYVLFHEMGHSLGLGHVNELGQSMYPSVTMLPSDNWCRRDSITADERDAIRYYISMCQNFSFRACGLMPMEPNQDCSNVYGLPLSVFRSDDERIGQMIYPNPVKDVFNFSETLPRPMEVFMFDHLGKMCLHTSMDSNEPLILDSDLKNGIYFIRITNGHFSWYEKILLHR